MDRVKHLPVYTGGANIKPNENKDSACDVLSLHSQGKVIVKMLENNGSDEFKRTKQEISESRNSPDQHIPCASVSLLIPGVPMEPFRKIGLLIDSTKVSIKHISSDDCFTYPVDDDGVKVYWNPDELCYKKLIERGVEISRSFKGLFMAFSNPDKVLKTLSDLKVYIKRLSEETSGNKIDWNELVIDYARSAIIGIVFVESSHQEILEATKAFKELINDELSLSLSVFKYTLSTGQLSQYVNA